MAHLGGVARPLQFVNFCVDLITKEIDLTRLDENP